ncbi:hypothetical protein ACH5A3_32780 [Streptomyces echinatus]|uniref:hypothetical protein n=1 Tax=Streptomyces echinatus TaxID=67293 RepID=UPI0037B08002
MSGLVESLLRERVDDPRIDTATMSVALVGAISEMLLSWFNGVLHVSRTELVDQGLLLFEALTEHVSAVSTSASFRLRHGS